MPRPIGWISTVSRDGICNIAPYSFFNAVGEKPHYVMFSSSGRKDSLINIEETGEFVVLARHLGPALQHEHDLGVRAPRRRRVPDRRSDRRAEPARQAAARQGKPGRLRMQALEDHRAAARCDPGGKPERTRWCSARSSASTSTTASSRTAWSTPAPCGPSRRLGYMDYAVVTPETVFSIDRPTPRRRWPS